jgi:hypothetical protein
MENLNPNVTNAEIRLRMIEDILKTSFQEVKKQFLSKDRFNDKLSEYQARCMKIKASEIIFGNAGHVLNDFEITIDSFKKMKINFEYLHFHFIDRVSINLELGTSIADFGNDLYYMIIVCDQGGDLLHFDFDDTNIYDAYIVNGNLDVEEIQSFNKIKYRNIRKTFLSNVGDRIRKNSTYNSVTEYITFDMQHVEEFQNALNDEDIRFKVRVISICEYCDVDSTSASVSNYLKDPKNQQKLSLAFQKYNISQDSNFYDIGNMQP